MSSSCSCVERARGVRVPCGPSRVPLDGFSLAPRPVVTPHPGFPGWAGLVRWWRLALSVILLAFPGVAGAARVSSSLSTTHHVHHFHNKHGTVPIAINRMPFLTRGGHAGALPVTSLRYACAPYLRFPVTQVLISLQPLGAGPGDVGTLKGGGAPARREGPARFSSRQVK
ncbi:hypothetical protein SKAU_G00364520 [Synaphobranchus kaupii]|uniref:Uncharacterized protein n=1 Tax=Synaphobranchus kaupii TaxID=118154 RepID=A0A9Q1IFC5_SYNKA|nr:hypothetical protein SKAU_G00364520 [Synaphobranchus kaupii]